MFSTESLVATMAMSTNLPTLRRIESQVDLVKASVPRTTSNDAFATRRSLTKDMDAVDGLISGLPGAMLKGCTKTNVKALIMSELQKIKIEPTPPPTATVSAGQSSATAILLADDAETPPHGPKIPIDPSNGPGVKTMTIASNALDINSESCQIMIAMASMLKEKCPDEHTRLSSTPSADLSARSKRFKTALFAAAALQSVEMIKGNKQSF